MSVVFDLVQHDIAIAEAREEGMKAFAWYDLRAEGWRCAKRNGKGRYPVHSRAWPTTWKLVQCEAFQVALYSPYFERICRQSARGAA